jgi:hypothetical protein
MESACTSNCAVETGKTTRGVAGRQKEGAEFLVKVALLDVGIAN